MGKVYFELYRDCEVCNTRFRVKYYEDYICYKCQDRLSTKHKTNKRIRTLKQANNETKICAWCNKEFRIDFKNSNVKYCSEECRKQKAREHNRKTREQINRRIKNGDKELILKRKFDQYRRGAESRGYEFKLSKDQFEEHYNKPCHYCGAIVNGIGLDRKDNSKGYTTDNIVDCCTYCNTFKLGRDYKEFINKIYQIYNNMNNKSDSNPSIH